MSDSKEHYVDHEVRIRMLERLSHQLNSKMNAMITIAITAVLIPLALKYFS